MLRKIALLFSALCFATIAHAQTYTGTQVVTGNTNIPTYSAATVALANTGAGDLYCITGSATKIVKIKGIRISAVATAAIVGDVSVVLRSAANTGGTATAPAVVKMDQSNAAGTATVAAYTVSPTPGAAIGTVRARKMAVSTAGNAATSSEGLFQFSVYWDQPLTLRGTSQLACVVASAFGAGASFDIDHEHTEE
jgi:hypothetical protein